MELGSMHFRNRNFADSAMAKSLGNTGVNEFKVLIFNSDSEEEFMLNDSDFERTQDFLVYGDKSFKE
jgi:hypothetical protein